MQVIEPLGETTPLPIGAPSPTDIQTTVAASCAQRLERLAVAYKGRVQIEHKVLQGAAFIEITRDALRNARDLVIKVPEEIDWLDRLFGSDDMHLLRKCPCPAWMIRSTAPSAYRRVVAAVDVDTSFPASANVQSTDALNRSIREIAGSVAIADFADLHVVTVWDAMAESTIRGANVRPAPEDIAAYVEQVRRLHDSNLTSLVDETLGKQDPATPKFLKPRPHLVKARARKEIPAFTKWLGADLDVIGTVAHRNPRFHHGQHGRNDPESD